MDNKEQLTIRHLEWAPNYQVDVNGNVYSKRRPSTKGDILKQWKDKYGYLRVSLWVDGSLMQKQAHRLVAELFVSNEDNKPQVNHINGIKTDNRAENLEWCTISENTIHAYKTGLLVSPHLGKVGYDSTRGIEVFQYDMDGNLIDTFGSIELASKHTNVNRGNISQCINNKLKTAGGFIWKRN